MSIQEVEFYMALAGVVIGLIAIGGLVRVALEVRAVHPKRFKVSGVRIDHAVRALEESMREAARKKRGE